MWTIKIEEILNDSIYEIVASVTTVSEVRAFLNTNFVDIIISDIYLEDSSIFDLMVDDNFTDIPVVFISNSFEGDLLNLNKFHKKCTYLSKPILKKTLINTVELVHAAFLKSIR